jgi:hypothetical protein
MYRVCFGQDGDDFRTTEIVLGKNMQDLLNRSEAAARITL